MTGQNKGNIFSRKYSRYIYKLEQKSGENPLVFIKNTLEFKNY